MLYQAGVFQHFVIWCGHLAELISYSASYCKSRTCISLYFHNIFDLKRKLKKYINNCQNITLLFRVASLQLPVLYIQLPVILISLNGTLMMGIIPRSLISCGPLQKECAWNQGLIQEFPWIHVCETCFIIVMRLDTFGFVDECLLIS